jgi:beta-carotene 3-hydroxylase
VFDLLSHAPDVSQKVMTWVAVGLPVAFGMELWARVLHQHLWHGPLWFLHESHHRERDGWFELNDVFAVFHAAIGISLILYGCVGPVGYGREIAFGWGLGMSAFGMSYFLIHDGLVHERLPVAFLERIPWIHRLAAAHRAHHVTHRRDSHPYGLFLGPQEARAESRRRRARASTERA